MTRIALDDPRYYFNRHLQWLEFNRRVLEEARDIGNPLLERVKFLAITANNLDEFVEVRVSSVLQRIEHGSHKTGPDGLTAEQELENVSAAMHIFVRDQYKCWNAELLPALTKQSIRVLLMNELDSKASQAAKTFYERRVTPMLTPVTVDPSHPFSHVLNKALCIAFLLRRRRRGSGKAYFGVVTVPRALPRLLRLPATDTGIHYVFLQDIISTYAAKLYRGYEILASAAFRITRNSNLYLEEEETRSLLDAVDSQVAHRRKGDAVRLEIEAGADPEIRRYAHLGTGNYNPSTARFYTDLSLLTRDDAITSAVHDVFNYLTAYAEQPHYKPLLLAPRDMAKTCIALVEREARHARRGRPARIIVKVNAIIDAPLIQALYRASRAGVDIDLIVRGQCTLVPGLRGLSSRIRVRSIVGRFLEHSRIFYFENGGKPEVYLGSADWMPRNLYERVEILFPLKDPQHCVRVCTEILSSYLADARKARILGTGGAYSRPRAVRNGHGFSAQEHLMRLAEGTDDSPRTSVLRTPSVVYTSREATAVPADSKVETSARTP